MTELTDCSDDRYGYSPRFFCAWRRVPMLHSGAAADSDMTHAIQCIRHNAWKESPGTCSTSSADCLATPTLLECSMTYHQPDLTAS